MNAVATQYKMFPWFIVPKSVWFLYYFHFTSGSMFYCDQKQTLKQTVMLEQK